MIDSAIRIATGLWQSISSYDSTWGWGWTGRMRKPCIFPKS